MTEMIRAFIALPLPDEVKRVLGRASENLANQAPRGSVRWVKPERMHLTLRFLGDTAVAKLPALSQKLDQLGQRHPPFALHLDGLGFFPNRKRPRIIWAGLNGDVNALLALKQGLDALLEPMGWERERRPFRAHLTLGRVKDSRRLAQVNWAVKWERLPVPVWELSLIESQLRPDGPVYTIRHKSKLGGTS